MIQREVLLEKIMSHSLFHNLDFVKQQRIVCPLFLSWLMTVQECILIDKDRAQKILANHTSLCEDFKYIYIDILFITQL